MCAVVCCGGGGWCDEVWWGGGLKLPRQNATWFLFNNLSEEIDKTARHNLVTEFERAGVMRRSKLHPQQRAVSERWSEAVVW